VSFVLFKYVTQEPLKIPGIAGLPVIGVTLELGIRPWVFLRDCKNKFGGVFGLNMAGKSIIMDGDREFTKTLFKAPDSKANYGMKIINTFGMNLFVNPTAIHNRSFIGVLKVSMSAQLPKFFDPILKQGREFMEQKIGEKMQFNDILSEFCYPIVCMVTTRTVLGPEFDSDEKLRKLFIEYNKIAERLMGWALLCPKFLHPLVKYIYRQDDEYVKQVVLPVLKLRRQQGGDPKTPNLLQDLIDAGMDDQYILDIVKTIMWASVMNTSSTFSHLINDVFYRPQVAEKIREEQKGIPQVTYESLEKMQYIDACMRESLRMASPACGAAREINENFEWNNKIIPKDSIVLISRYLLHHDESSWKDPFTYVPERFLEQKIPKYAFIPFGGGVHGCPGRYYAILVLKELFAELVRNYDVETEGPRPPYKILGNEVRAENAKITFIRKH